MEAEQIGLLSKELGRVIYDVNQFTVNPEITRACHSLLVAANELTVLLNDDLLRKEDLRYLNSALQWSDKARSILSDLAVELHEQR